jgi:hypothetical protein
MSHDDFAFEPIPGVPSALPAGERILWQGAPHWRAIARGSMFTRPVAIYFAAMMLWRGADSHASGASIARAIADAATLLPVAAAALALLVFLSWIYARSTVYTITDRRLIVRSGVALPITVNIPFAVIAQAGLARTTDGRGQILLTLAPDHKVAYLALWPHVRPWRMSRTEPLLMGLSDPDSVAQILGRALAQSTAPVPDLAAVSEQPAAEPRDTRPARPMRLARPALRPDSAQLGGATS